MRSKSVELQVAHVTASYIPRLLADDTLTVFSSCWLIRDVILNFSLLDCQMIAFSLRWSTLKEYSYRVKKMKV